MSQREALMVQEHKQRMQEAKQDGLNVLGSDLLYRKRSYVSKLRSSMDTQRS
jgi:hypothetical protein